MNLYRVGDAHTFVIVIAKNELKAKELVFKKHQYFNDIYDVKFLTDSLDEFVSDVIEL